MFAEHLAQEPGGIADHLADIHEHRLGLFPPGEGQQVLDQPPGPVGGLLDLLHVPADGSPLGRALRGLGDDHLIADQARVIGDHGEDIAEVVRDSAHELPQARQALRPLQLALQPLHLGPAFFRRGGVLDEDREITLAGGRPDHRSGQLRPEDLAILADQARFRPDLAGRAGGDVLDQDLERGLVFRVEMAQEVAAAKFRSRVARQPAVRVVDREADAAEAGGQADGDQAEGRRAELTPELLLTGPQCVSPGPGGHIGSGRPLIRSGVVVVRHGCPLGTAIWCHKVIKY